MNIFMRIFSLLPIIIGLIGFIITVTNKKMKWGKQKNTGNSDGTCDFYLGLRKILCKRATNQIV